MIHAILYLNAGRLISDGRTAAQRWLDMAPSLMEVPQEELRQQALPRMEEVKLTRKGFRVNGLWYGPEVMAGLRVGDSYTVAYDPNDMKAVYVVCPDSFTPCYSNLLMSNLSKEELSLSTRKARKGQNEEQVQASVQSIQAITGIVAGASDLKRRLAEELLDGRQYEERLREKDQREGQQEGRGETL